MVATFNEDLFDSMVRHQIGVQRFSAGIRNRMWALLDATEADLKSRILNSKRFGLETPREIRNLNTLLEKLKESRLGGWKAARSMWFTEMRGLANAEPGFFDRVFAGAFPGVELGTTLPDPERLRQITKSRPFHGKTMLEWANNMQGADLARLENVIKVGLVQGEGPNQIARRLVGTAAQSGRNGATQITRNQAASVVRTVTNGIASEARREYSLLNKDIAPRDLFIATLDARTTPICRKFDGKTFAAGRGPRLPLHMGERSLRSPIADGDVIGQRPVRGFTEQSLIRDFYRDNRIKGRVPKSRRDLPRGLKGDFDKFKRPRMRELTGTVPAKTTYQQFLQRQSAAIQDDILGLTRGILFRRGGLKLDKFVSAKGTELTLSQLAASNAAAFRRAGLDPLAFAA